MKSFSFRDRLQNIEKMQSNYFDLIIIGGGINGAGVARNAASRGMKVAVVEAADFASGTSSRSSKLIHGGIRYLENLEFSLVFEALNERARLFEIAPHLVHPLRFMLPLYKGGRVGMFKMGLGMWLYDALALFQVPEMHERLDASETLARFPELKKQDLLGSYVYSDAYMDDDRLVFETLRSANELGAICANFVKAVGAIFSNEKKVVGIDCEDLLSQKKFKISGRHIVSTVGPWTDELGQLFFQNWEKILRPTKGVHITVPSHRLPLASAVVMAAEERIVFAIPRPDMVIIGTTDTDYKNSPGEVVTTDEDVRYLLGIAANYFGAAHLELSDVIGCYAGIRPLVKDNSSSEGKTSREHTILDDERGVTFVAGGKYTTYRAMAEEIVEHVLDAFSIEERIKFGKSQTEVPLNPFATLDTIEKAGMQLERWAQATRYSASAISKLIDRHGLEAGELIRNKHPLPGRRWTPLQLEALHAIRNTMCLNLDDFLARRVPMMLAEFDHGICFLDEIIEVFSIELNWSEDQANLQKQRVIAYIEKNQIDQFRAKQ